MSDMIFSLFIFFASTPHIWILFTLHFFCWLHSGSITRQIFDRWPFDVVTSCSLIRAIFFRFVSISGQIVFYGPPLYSSTTNHSWTPEINGIYSGKENLLLIWSHKSWLGILINIILKKKKISWLVFSLFIVLKFPTLQK